MTVYGVLFALFMFIVGCACGILFEKCVNKLYEIKENEEDDSEDEQIQAC